MNAKRSLTILMPLCIIKGATYFSEVLLLENSLLAIVCVSGDIATETFVNTCNCSFSDLYNYNDTPLQSFQMATCNQAAGYHCCCYFYLTGVQSNKEHKIEMGKKTKNKIVIRMTVCRHKCTG